MLTSESTVKIGKALVAALGELSNPANTATNPFFKSKYAPLPDILNHVRPVLSKHGLCVLQDAGVTTRIVHESGEWIESDRLTLTPQKDDPQGEGGAITYARRYSLSAMLGISSEDDDDANYASQAPQLPTQPATQRPVHHSARGPVNQCTDKQHKFIRSLLKQKATDPDAAASNIKAKFGLEHLPDLSFDQASKVIEELKKRDDVATPPGDER